MTRCLMFYKKMFMKRSNVFVAVVVLGFFLMAEPTAYASFQARDQVQATARSLTHCARLGNRTQATAETTPDPFPTVPQPELQRADLF